MSEADGKVRSLCMQGNSRDPLTSSSHFLFLSHFLSHFHSFLDDSSNTPKVILLILRSGSDCPVALAWVWRILPKTSD